MGTDVYLSWDKMNKEDHDKQITGFDIDSGDKGYLRASIGMVKENQVLNIIFPDHWELEDPLEYDFESNMDKMVKLGALYLISVMTGKEIKPTGAAKKSEEMVKRMKSLLGNLGFDKIDSSEGMDFRGAVMWINSLFNFMELGLEKQKAGLKPKIYISW